MAMKLTLLFVGKTKEHFIQLGIDEYLDRLRHYVPVDIKVAKNEKVGPKANKNRIIESECKNLLSKLSRRAYLIALDRTGQQLTSVEMAGYLMDLEHDATEEIVFITGGPLGLSPSLLKQCQRIVSLSRLTLTHEMSRLLLLEQLYRAYTIRAGHKYHK